ncbi:MAG: phosphate ABC transporter substrate-binding protein [Thermoanaerobacterales bacterium]|nr:phosphate ABC transporter substrate-binding protein [Bacillota bacterium]MDI6906893.1 phosphate ABC transporter substrate-binding protein [Thermoanaerobacterales bacterium]
MLKTKWFAVLAVAVLAVALVVSGCGQQDGSEKPQQQEQELSGNITAVGSTALQPLVEEAANAFMAENSGVKISVQGGGSGTGLSQVSSGGADIGNSDVFAEEKDGIDASQLKDHKVCVVGFALVTHPSNKVDNLTKQQIKDIFTGKIKNWKEVGGDDQKIVLVNRAKGSGTRATFKKYVMDGTEEAKGDAEQESSGTVRKIVSETPGAISYLALSYVDGSVKAMKIDGAEPSTDNIGTGKYPFWSYEHMYTKGEPTGAVKAFLDYMVSDEVQKTLVEKLGYIPITAMQVERQP